MNPEPYPFLFKGDGTPLVEELITFRETVAGLRKTNPVFRPSHHLERSVYYHFHQNPELLYLCDSWQVPDWFTGDGNYVKNRFVNPHNPHKSFYSMAGAECTCGNIIHHSPFSRGGDIENDHSDGCTPPERKEAADRLHALRLNRLLIGGHLRQSYSEIAPSIGMSEDAASTMVERSCVDWEGVKIVGRMRLKNTITCLSEMGYSHQDIGDALGMSRSSVSEYYNGRNSRWEQDFQATA